MIRKYSLLSIVFLLLFAGIATAQSICTISGTLYRADGVTPAAYGQLEIIQTVKVGATISTKKLPVRADANGLLSFQARQGSSITLKGDFYGYTSGVTVNVPNASTANLEDLVILSTVFTTAGDMVYAGANGVPTRLPIGANGRVLKVSGGLPVWAVESGGGGGSSVWGGITGMLSDQTDLQTALDAKAASSHTHTFSSLTSKPTTLSGYGITDAAPLASPALTGVPTAPTATNGTNTTQIATTAFVQAAVSAATAGVASFNGRTGTVVPATNDYTFAQIGSKPTTLSGYGITDAYPLSGNPSSFLTANQAITLSGDLSGSGTTAITGTLATVNASPGSFGGAAKSLSATVNGKGLITSLSEQNIAIAASQVSSGTFSVARGGTGLSTVASGKLLYASALDTLSELTLASTFGITVGTLDISAGGITNNMLAGSIANAKLANSAITIAGTSTSLGGSITASAILDSIGSTRGSVLYRGVSGWAALSPGTSGQVLTSNGAGADPSYQTVSGGGGTPAGSTGDYQINSSGSFGAGVLAQSSGRLTATPTTISSGTTSYFRLITPADTTLTASTESIGAQFGGNTSAATVTRNWAAGALTTQREYVFVAPTYSFASASTISDAATVAISGPPTAGTNATITRRSALWIQSGNVILANNSRLQGRLTGGSATTLIALDNTFTGVDTIRLGGNLGESNLPVQVYVANGTVASSAGFSVWGGGAALLSTFMADAANTRGATAIGSGNSMTADTLSVYDAQSANNTTVRLRAASSQVSSSNIFSIYLNNNSTKTFALARDGYVENYNAASTAGVGVVPVYASVASTAQTASITATNLQVGGAAAPAGIYKVTYYVVTTTAGTSGTLDVTIGWNDGAASRSDTYIGALTFGATGYATRQIIVRANGTNNITYATTVNSAVGSPAYSIYVTLERIA